MASKQRTEKQSKYELKRIKHDPLMAESNEERSTDISSQLQNIDKCARNSMLAVTVVIIMLSVGLILALIYLSKSVYHRFGWMMTFIALIWSILTIRFQAYLIRIGHFHGYGHLMRPIELEHDVKSEMNDHYVLFVIHRIIMKHFQSVQSVSSWSQLRGSTHALTLTNCLAVHSMIGVCAAINVMSEPQISTQIFIAASCILSACVGAMLVGFLEVDNDTNNAFFSDIKFGLHFIGWVFLCIGGVIGYWMLNDFKTEFHASFVLVVVGICGFIAYITIRAIAHLKMEKNHGKMKFCPSGCKDCVIHRCRLFKTNFEDEKEVYNEDEVQNHGIVFVIIQGLATLPGFIACTLFVFQYGGPL